MRGFVLGLRPWLAALVVWTVAAATIYGRAPNTRGVTAMALLLTFLIGTAGLIKVLWPMRTYGHPPRLVAAGRPRWVHTYTGHVGSASKTGITSFQADSSVNQNPMTGDLTHRLSVQQQTVVQDNLTLLGADGTQVNIQLRWFNLAVGPGQLVSVAWPALARGRRGPYLLIRNHSTGQVTYARALLWWLATGRAAVAYLICMWLGALLWAAGGYPRMAALWFFLLPLVYIALGYLRAARFTRGSRSLVEFLDGVAATFASSGSAGPAVAVLGQSPVSPAAPPPPPPAVNAAAAWYADPTGRHDHRYFDGMRWTDRVADASVQALDPL